ncbi:hypothetical protein [Dactylosporangium sp. NPDC051541]|uniref:hypothetical protein n=1 Tax=Dactylosporangium sp. NPDC051541 TaxID=3363977 RepID=UPI00379CFD39
MCDLSATPPVRQESYEPGAPGAGPAGPDPGPEPAEDLPGDAGKATGQVLIPLITARKGLLFDRITAHGAGGATLPVLSQWESRGLIALALQSLFRVARRDTSG